VKHTQDAEAYEQLLADESIRDEFYARLSDYAKTLSIALSSEKFLFEVDETLLARYKADLKQFQKLKASVKLRYAEAIDYRDYEPKIQKLLDTHIQANEVVQLNEPVNIFDDETFNEVKEEQGVYGKQPRTAAKADTIAHATKKVITEKMDEDPAFYEKFSIMIQRAIEDFRAKRISDLDYLNRVVEIRNKVVGKVHDDVPNALKGKEDAQAYFGVVQPFFNEHPQEPAALEAMAADTALAVDAILQAQMKVNFWQDSDAQKAVIDAIDDFCFDELRAKRGLELSFDQIDAMTEKLMQVARSRS